jgi:hypothetical protein
MEAQTLAWTILAAVLAGLILAAVMEFGVRAERLANEAVAQSDTGNRLTRGAERISVGQ